MMDFDVLPWSLVLQIIASVFHCVAIACTVFRLFYRWYMARFWWEDGWAAFALAVDIPCLVSVWIESPTTGGAPPIDRTAEWIAELTFTTVVWVCRLSILFSVIRVANPSQPQRRISFLVGGVFALMWLALLIQKIVACKSTCTLGISFGIIQLTTNALADAVLVMLPIWFFRRSRITLRQRIMLYPVFFATFAITVVTIVHSAVLFIATSSGTILIGHVKTAVSLIVCNLLVLVTFMYRICRRGNGGDLDAEEPTFTNVDLNTGFFTDTSNTNKQTADGLQEETSSPVRPRSTMTESSERWGRTLSSSCGA